MRRSFTIASSLLLTACFVGAPPVATQPTGTAAGPAGYPTQASACSQQLRTFNITYCSRPAPNPLPPGYAEDLRFRRDGLAERCTAPADQVPLEEATACVVALEQSYAAQDPEAAERREASKETAAAVKESQEFRAHIDAWRTAYDRKLIQCRYAKESEADRRECERHQGYVKDVSDRLSAFLESKGLDRRDFRVLGLWPSGSAHDR